MTLRPLLPSLLVLLTAARSAALAAPPLAPALALHASFDRTADADHARGDGRIFTAATPGQRATANPGLPSAEVARLVPDAGRFGGALEFRSRTRNQVFFRGGQNFGFRPGSWAGSVSLWLRLDPEKDLAPGYCDPFQLVAEKWNEGSLFVEFTKDHQPRHFRFGIFPITRFWNPQGKQLEEMADPERPMVYVRRPAFSHDRWTHVLVTFANINSGRTDGRGTLYLDGEPIGTSEGWNHAFNWDPAQAVLTLGLNYTGFIDDVAVFDRELTATEVRFIHGLPGGISSLRPANP